jgi:hypothetical protein
MTTINPRQNGLLAALSAVELKRRRRQLELVDLPLGKILYEPGRLLEHVYFPVDCIISLLYVLENGASAEIALRRYAVTGGHHLNGDGDRVQPASTHSSPH